MYSEDSGGLADTGLHRIRFEVDTELKRMSVTYRFTLDDVYGIGVVDMGIVNASRQNVSGGRILDAVTDPVFTYNHGLKMEG